MPFDTLVENIAQLVTADPARANDADPLGRIGNAAIGITAGRIAWIGPQTELPDGAREQAGDVVDARAAVAMPGLIDSHTHPVFGGSREQEFARRIAGVPYMQIAQEGGGINATVRMTRAADAEGLFARSRGWMAEMLAHGVTTIEGKSGYGLDTESELKQLAVLGRMNNETPMEVVPTFLGAHEFPSEYKQRREAYVDLVIEEMLPAVAEQGIAKLCDVFCEEGVFTIAQTRRILEAGKAYGLLPRFHADEFVYSGGAELAAEQGALAADHLTAVTEAGMDALARAGVCACVLPGTSFYLGHGHYARARELLARGATLVVASDFNPGSCVISNLAQVAGIAVTQMKLTFEEIVLAVTRNAAQSLGLSHVGHLAVGMQADFVMLDMPLPEYWIYHQGRNHVQQVFKRGVCVWENPREPVYLG